MQSVWRGDHRYQKSSGGGAAIGFNINRINIVLSFFGGALIVLGVRETILSGKAQAEPTQMTLQQLIENGLGDNIHLMLTDVQCSEEYVAYGDEEPGGQVTRYDTVWLPAAPTGANFQNVKLIIKSTDAETDGEVDRLGNQTTHTGLIVNDIDSIGSKEREFLQQGLPGTNLDSVYIFHESRKPSGALMIILYFAGGLVLLGGGLAWIFLLH